MPYIGQKPHDKVVTASEISDGIITADKLASDSVTTAKIADNGVTTAKINADAVTDAKVADDVIGTEHLTAGEVDTTALADDAVTAAKLANDIGISTTGNIATTSSGTLTSAGLITASSGVAVGGTGSANTLDDYEEGTWTPQLKISGATTGIVYGTQAGHYTKIGNRVIASAEILLSNKGSNTGNVSMIGLPFTTSNDNYQNASTYNDRVSSPNGDVQVFLLTNSTTASIYQSRTDGTNNGHLTGNEMNNDSYLVMFMTYKTG